MQVPGLGETAVFAALIAGVTLVLVAATAMAATSAGRAGEGKIDGVFKLMLAVYGAVAIALALAGFPVAALSVVTLTAASYLVFKDLPFIGRQYWILLAGHAGGSLLWEIFGPQEGILETAAWAALCAASLGVVFHAVPIGRRPALTWAGCGAILVLAATWSAALDHVLWATVLVGVSAVVLVPLLRSVVQAPYRPRTVAVLIGSVVAGIIVSQGLIFPFHTIYASEVWPVAGRTSEACLPLRPMTHCTLSVFQPRYTSETRTIELAPGGEEIRLRVVREGDGAARSMDLLEHSVRFVAGFMGDAGPLMNDSPVTIVFGDAALSPGVAASFVPDLGLIISRPEYDVDDGSFESESAGNIITHEVGHYYFYGPNALWVNEGAVSFLAVLFESSRLAREPSPALRDSSSCPPLSELVVHRPREETEEHFCNYALGERLFLDLYFTMGEAAFKQGFQDLYRRGEKGPLGSADVRAAFTEAAPPGSVSEVE